MRSINRKKGDIGEDIASKWLEINKNYCILERNYSTRYGEIDIIAQDNNFYVFIEVKYRSSNSHGLPYEAVTLPKQDRIAKSALCYMQKKDLTSTHRFDLMLLKYLRVETKIKSI